ncbi:ATP-binding cassette domain-containing protein, partial [Candidatus Dependentiae bacterium]|nr:ATP-binding cassette domain-containing protein [Candidatus Dependentiae bacterium]
RKSTTIKMLTGILTPDSGEITVNGYIPYKQRIKNNFQIGAVFGQRTQLWWDVPVIESYKLIKKIYEVPDDIYKKNLQQFTELLGLEDLLNTPVRQLSLGQKMRCEICAVFIHNPKIVFLDEPTIGLDVMVKDKIRKFIKKLNADKKITVILTTHDLQDIEEVCNRIIIIDKGIIIYDGTINNIKDKFGKYRVISFKINNAKENIHQLFSKNKNLEIIEKDEYNLSIKFNRTNITAATVIELVSEYCKIIDLSISEPSIESIVKDIFNPENSVQN